jgi:hypothetical protein
VDLGDLLRQCERRERSLLPHVREISTNFLSSGSPNGNCSAWARDETPSPTEEDSNAPNLSTRSLSRRNDPSTSYSHAQRPAWDAASTDTDATERDQSRWWVFTRPRRQQSPEPPNVPLTELNAETPRLSTDAKGKAPEDGRRPMSQRLKSTVLMAADSAERWRQRRRPTTSASRSNSGHQEMSDDGDTIIAAHMAEPSAGTMSSTLASSSRTKPAGTKGELRLDIPAVPKDAYTVPYNDTPGWQSPWAPYRARQRSANLLELSSRVGREHRYTPSETESEKRLGPWGKRGRKLRRYILYNDFTPLVSEFGYPHLNIPCA